MSNDITYIHRSRNHYEYITRCNEILKFWFDQGLSIFSSYFHNQWLSPPFDQWQLFRRPPGFPTIAINESFNKQFKEKFTKYKMLTIIDTFKKTLPTVIRYYSEHPKPFALYPSQINHRAEVVAKANKLTKEQFIRFDFNTFRCDCFSLSGVAYCHFIRVYPTYVGSNICCKA